MYSIEFTNSDPVLVSLFHSFMIQQLAIDPKSIKAQLFMYPDLDEDKVRNEWSEKVGIPREQFQKVIMLKAKVSKFKPNPLGTLKIRHTNKQKFILLQTIIEDVKRRAVTLVS